LSGEAADEVFGGYRWFQPGDHQADFPWRQVIDQGDLTRLLDPGLAAALDLPAHRRELYTQAVGELGHLDSASERERQLRVNSYLNLTRFLPVLLERTDRLSMSTGLEDAGEGSAGHVAQPGQVLDGPRFGGAGVRRLRGGVRVRDAGCARRRRRG
jgi:asparagine synthetase B (glutamine-hydrolysing)